MSLALGLTFIWIFTWGNIENIGVFILICGILILSTLVNMPMFFFCLKSEWVGFDEVSFILSLMCVLIMMISLVSSFKDLQEKVSSEVGGFNLVELVVIVTLTSILFFQSCSWMDFFFFFEVSLIPVFFIILKWGYRFERLSASMGMMVYTVGFSLPFFMGLLNFWVSSGSDSMLLFKMLSSFDQKSMKFFWLLMIMSFIVKLPVYGVHSWLPKAHVEAPLAGSMILAGVMLKFGGFGMIRFMEFTGVSFNSGVLFISVVSLWGGVLASSMCLCQSDLKSLIAYSSIGHMGLSLSSLLTFYNLGKESCVCLMFSHGLTSPLLFAFCASMFDLTKSRNIMMTKGVLRIFPMFSVMCYVSCMLSMGLPPSLGFYGELFSVVSLFWQNGFFGFMSALCSFVSGCYCFLVYGLVSHGSVSEMSNFCVTMSMRYIFSAVFVTIFLCLGGFGLDLFFV